MMMVKVIARTIGLHRLILLNFYPFLQKYVQPHQRDVTDLLAAAVQACHDMVPPDAVEPLFRQIVNQFVHDRSRTEAIAVGLNVVREICLRIPLLMTEELLQDLVLYKKSHERAVSSAARSLITLFRQVCPSLLVKKDRGRLSDAKAFGEVNFASNVPGAELLLQHDNDSSVVGSEEDDDANNNVQVEDENGDDSDDIEDIDVQSMFEDEEEGIEIEEVDDDEEGDDDHEDDDEGGGGGDNDEGGSGNDEDEDDDDDDDEDEEEEPKGQKRKFFFSKEKMQLAYQSLRSLKKLAGAVIGNVSSDLTDGILSNEDFRRIKELTAKKEAKLVLAQQGLFKRGSMDSKSRPFKIPSSEQLSEKRVDPAKLEANIRRKLSKEERLAMVKAGREDRGKYQARAAVKQKKSGGLSNRQKEHKKAMPLAAKRAKIERSRQARKKQDRRSGKQFRGKKAWK